MAEAEIVLNNYRKAVRKLYGDAIADATNLYYHNGWYYVSVARKCPDGSYFTSSIADGRRKRQIIEMTDNLLTRV